MADLKRIKDVIGKIAKNKNVRTAANIALTAASFTPVGKVGKLAKVAGRAGFVGKSLLNARKLKAVRGMLKKAPPMTGGFF